MLEEKADEGGSVHLRARTSPNTAWLLVRRPRSPGHGDALSVACVCARARARRRLRPPTTPAVVASAALAILAI